LLDGSPTELPDGQRVKESGLASVVPPSEERDAGGQQIDGFFVELLEAPQGDAADH